MDQIKAGKKNLRLRRGENGAIQFDLTTPMAYNHTKG
jgi:hypothetical protein